MAFKYDKEEWLRHVKSEMDLAAEQPHIREFYEKMMDAFVEYPHNENTIYYMPEVLRKMFAHENLRSLTEHPNEWVQVSDELWRNKRNPKYYSNDQGKTYFFAPHSGDNHSNNTIIPTKLPKDIEEAFDKLKDVKPF